MIAPTTRISPRWAPAAVCLTIAIGIAVGWCLTPAAKPTFEYVYAVLSPAGFAAMCISAALRSPRHAGWFVPLALTLVLLDVVDSPQVPALTALGLVAALVATISSLAGRKRLAIAAVLICCTSASASSLIGLSDR